MATSLSTDLRQRLISAVESGQSCRAAAKRFGVAASTAIKWVSRWRSEGHAEARPRGGDRHSYRMEALAEEILGLVAQSPDITLAEIAAHLEAAHGRRIAPSSVWRLLDRHGMTFKKNGARQRAATARRSAAATRVVRPPTGA
jgi:transposase